MTQKNKPENAKPQTTSKSASGSASDDDPIFGSLDAGFIPDKTDIIGTLRKLNANQIAHITYRLSQAAQQHLLHSWDLWAHAGQYPDASDWRVWMILAGRGFGKTRAGAEWVKAAAAANPHWRIALVGATLDDVRQVMIEGQSGLLAIADAQDVPIWFPSQGKLQFANGATAYVYSAETPDKLRGPQHHIAWCDELAKWPHAEPTWDNLMLGLRLADRPQAMVTSTPRPTPLLARLMAEPGVVICTGRTRDNVHLPTAFVEQVEAQYGGTRLGRQELDGEYLTDVPGALWTLAGIDAVRVAAAPAPDALRRVVIGVDPPAGSISGAAGDACGIIVVALSDVGASDVGASDVGGADQRGYVLADHSVVGASPEGWARAVADAAALWGADRVIAEANQGGKMVASVLKAACITLPVKLVHASRGKSARAEPIAALYEAGRVHHVGAFPALEDEMCGLIAGGGYQRILAAGAARGGTAVAGKSPDRADALVWALTELMLSPAAQASAAARVRWL
jgi:phage terminase large subunit-like protein